MAKKHEHYEVQSLGGLPYSVDTYDYKDALEEYRNATPPKRLYGINKDGSVHDIYSKD
jgi:hypothetical protein